MDLILEEYKALSVEYNKKKDAVDKAYKKMQDCYSACDTFYLETYAKRGNNWTTEDKARERELAEKHHQSITEYNELNNELINFSRYINNRMTNQK